jgi:hypothetical protein
VRTNIKIVLYLKKFKKKLESMSCQPLSAPNEPDDKVHDAFSDCVLAETTYFGQENSLGQH